MKALAQRCLERLRRSATMLAAALLLLTLADARAFAQNTSISTTAVQGLSFGDFMPGLSITVQPTSSTAARWQIVVLGPGFKTATVDIRFTLPPALTTTGGSMPISFGTSMARIVNGDGTSTTFDPAAGLTFLVKTEASVFLGGTASAPGGQRAGPYSGSIVMTATMR